MRLVVVVVAFILLTVGRAYAVTHAVNDDNDAVDVVPGDGVCLTAGGFCSLRAAIQEANALAGADEIVVPFGTYPLSLGGVGEENAATGDLDVVDDLTIKGTAVVAEFVDIDGAGADRVLDVKPGVEVTLAMLQISGGVAVLDPRGGGILNAGTLHLDRVHVRGNRADDGAGNGAGGGIHNLATLTISASGIFSNEISPGAAATGGGVYNAGGMTTVNSSIGFNGASGSASGVGVYNAAGATTDLRNVTVANNGDRFNPTLNGPGSGVYNAGGTVTFVNSIIANNTSNPPQDCAGTLTSGGYNLVRNASGCTLTGDLTGLQVGVDPLINPGFLHSNGGPTSHFVTSDSSPTIDAGNPVLPGSGGGACEARDQRGYARALGTRCDLGSEERGLCLPRLTPYTGCAGHQQLPGKGKFDFKNNVDDTKDALRWAFALGGLVADSAFGAGADDYLLCIYDQNGPVLEAVIPGGGICGSKPCWTDTSKGLKYKNKAATPNGVTQIKLTAGRPGAGAKIDLKGRGADLTFLPLPWSGKVSVRIQDESVPTPELSCWESTYSAPTKNDTTRFTARGD
jgi:CSLREA domain-containing protein